MSEKKIKIAIVGLGFGAEFIPIYKKHPNAELVAVCQRNEDKLNDAKDSFDKHVSSLEPFMESAIQVSFFIDNVF